MRVTRRAGVTNGLMARLDARALMERAVDVMRQSVAERRADGKLSPRVGALLMFPGSSGKCVGKVRGVGLI